VRVLYLAQHFPWPVVAGWQQRVFHTARLIARHHDTTLVTFARDPRSRGEASALEANRQALAAALGAEVRVVGDGDCGIRTTPALDDWAPALARTVQLLDSARPLFVRRWWSERLLAELRAMRHDAPDVVWANRVWMAEHACAAGLPRVVADFDDILSEARLAELRATPVYKSKPLHYAHAFKARHYERAVARRFGRLVVCKATDREFFHPRDRARCDVVPNGVQLPALGGAPPADPAQAPTLLFIGMLSYAPNVDAIRWLRAEILPAIWARMPHVRLQLAGIGDPAEVRAIVDGEPRISLAVGPDDLRPLYAAATLVVAPLRLGSGTRIKVLEALAHGRALVSTPFAAGGIGLRADEEVVFADRAQAFADACVALLRDPARRRALAAAGRARVAAEHTWDAVEPTVLRALAQVAEPVPA
jgi:glycosyltransferase involved in cell wall biosynthesis